MRTNRDEHEQREKFQTIQDQCSVRGRCPMSKEAVAAVREPETREEQLARLKKAAQKKIMSLPIQIMESDLFDHNPGVQMTLMVIALGTRSNPEAWIQDDCPKTAEEMMGWCDLAQWRIALRAKKSESKVNRDILKFEEMGILEIERWDDDNNGHHAMYRISRDVIKEHQRPQKKDTPRAPRYKVKNPNRGRFSAKNQPKKVASGVAEMDEE
jgi:hypothetical protein